MYQVMYHLVGHQNVVNVKEVLEDSSAVHIIMELCTGGTLYSYVSKSEGYTVRRSSG
jgi:calcium-dependent protein kinase